jgi:hypothetical protein
MLPVFLPALYVAWFGIKPKASGEISDQPDPVVPGRVHDLAGAS